MLGFEVAHIGINSENEQEANKTANLFTKFFNMPIKEGNSAIFVSPAIEVRKSKYLGKNGHIAVKTNYIERAINYIKAMGAEIDMETAVIKDGKITSVYLKEDFGGFAVHLLQK